MEKDRRLNKTFFEKEYPYREIAKIMNCFGDNPNINFKSLLLMSSITRHVILDIVYM
jgi:hypothetical protein